MQRQIKKNTVLGDQYHQVAADVLLWYIISGDGYDSISGDKSNPHKRNSNFLLINIAETSAFLCPCKSEKIGKCA